ncbi:hypothetical protein B0J11DRAFT_443306 [Dendryphion nanum]|uniref:Uncharacterized protein n=1 Tax=Dendryphion nanum TaxID=256645 RepID=A0A9P9ICY8_9PLEO|nr:hypothetical protein B0J11DRAFT_443306 [Dendryphion nanum]
MGSRHNLYLVTCTPSSDKPFCPNPRFCEPDESVPTKYTAVAYFANGPIEINQSLTEIATVTRPAQAWEGTLRVARLGKTSVFGSNIVREATGLKTGEIAGSAALDNEDFVCFKDGQVAFVVSDDLTHEPFTCKTDYWCPSIMV